MYDSYIMKPMQISFALKNTFGKKAASLGDFFSANSNVKPIFIANLVKNTLILLCFFSLLYVFLVINQFPSPQLFDRPVQIYQFQDVRKADKLFGQKEIDLSKLRLTGLMSSGAANGFAIFELDGKSSGAIAIGETFGKGYFLKNVSKESVEIVYQGKLYQIRMNSKTTKTTK